MLVAERGVGKTTQIAHLANAGFNVKVLDIDNKLQVMSAHLAEGHAAIDYVSLMPKVKESWEKAVELLTSWKMNTWGPDVVFVVDTASLLSDTGLNYAKTKHGATDKNVKFEQAIWGEYAERFENWTARIVADSNKFHVVFMCHPEQQTQLVGAPKIVGSFAGQKLLDAMPKMFNCVWTMERRGDKNVIKTVSDTGAVRTNAFPKVVGPETTDNLGEIFKKVLT